MTTSCHNTSPISLYSISLIFFFLALSKWTLTFHHYNTRIISDYQELFLHPKHHLSSLLFFHYIIISFPQPSKSFFFQILPSLCSHVVLHIFLISCFRPSQLTVLCTLAHPLYLRILHYNGWHNISVCHHFKKLY